MSSDSSSAVRLCSAKVAARPCRSRSSRFVGAVKYRIRVNGDQFVVHDPEPTGRAILTLAGLLPAENYTLRVKLAGEKPRKVGLDEKVDLRHPGVEKFKALPRDQTEG